jgi:hypothetical protein
MTEEQAENRFQHQLKRKRDRVEVLEAQVAEARRVADDYEKHKSSYVAYYKALP